MEEIKRILVVSRSTEECKKALHYGVLLAKAFGAAISVLHVEYDPFVKFGRVFGKLVVDFQEEYLADMKKIKSEIDDIVSLEKTEGLAIKEIIKEGDPVHETLEAVKNEKADLIVMASHEEGRIEHMIYGSTTNEIVRTMPCSVFLINRGESEGTEG